MDPPRSGDLTQTERYIIIDGIAHRVVGYLDDGYMLAVMNDTTGIGRVLIRDTLDGPWRLRELGGDS
jgi:hypothetical protein